MENVMIYEKVDKRIEHLDLTSRMFKDRILYLFGEVNDVTAYRLIQQMQYLEAVDSDADISLYINSGGGSVTAGLAIYDCMQQIKPDIKTYCIGMAASMASLLFCAGVKGKRFIYPNAEVMIHQPMSGFSGQASEIEIATKHLLNSKKNLNRILAKHTGRSIEEISKDTDRDNWLTAEQAIKYGICDDILDKEDDDNDKESTK